MVAVAGSGWVLAPSLVTYVLEADRYYPQRDRSSDGSVGDLAHQARVSDHIPSGGYVHAVDLDEDLAPGLDLKAFAEKLRTGRDERIKYVIYEGRTFASYISPNAPAWQWRPYDGINAHEHHLHLSMLGGTEHDTRPWGFAPTSTETDELSMADVAEILAALDTYDERNKKRYDDLNKDIAAIRAVIGADGVRNTLMNRTDVLVDDVRAIKKATV